MYHGLFNSGKYIYLYDVLPLISSEVYSCNLVLWNMLFCPACMDVYRFWYYFRVTFLKLNLNILMRRQNGRQFPDDIFKCIFLNEATWISIEISLNFVLKGLINNIPALFQIMAWRRPLSEPVVARLPTYICVTRPQWNKEYVRKTDAYCTVIFV